VKRIAIPLDEISRAESGVVGDKAFRLARLADAGFDVPCALSVTTNAYRSFLDSTGLRDMIRMELARKSFQDMRWEEIWDAALRIRAAFQRTRIPGRLAAEIDAPIRQVFGDAAVVVRSSAPGEDGRGASFAGLHDSFVNVRGVDDILHHISMVWASLWSDRALLYRKELDLDVESSEMAVLVQELVAGSCSGVVFTVHPEEETQGIIESVYGLNQGLVDGSVAPDRWVVDRRSGRAIEHTEPSERRCLVTAAADGIAETTAPERPSTPPLDACRLARVWELAGGCEELFGAPQDVEWTIAGDRLVTLQSRPITTLRPDGANDQRPWYLSLRRSFDNLERLRRRVEDELLLELDAAARDLAAAPVRDLTDDELADEIGRRSDIYDFWVDVYWREFIPLAHGIRLFGQFYNDVMRPDDTYEFMDLLAATPLLSLQRNRRLEEMASIIRRTPGLAETLGGTGGEAQNPELEESMQCFLEDFGGATYGEAQIYAERERLIRLLLEMSAHPPRHDRSDDPDRQVLVERFLESVAPERRQWAERLLDLGRASYRLRDDDNLHLGALGAQVLAASDEGRRRLRGRTRGDSSDVTEDDVTRALRDPNMIAEASPRDGPPPPPAGFELRPRQLVGQPASGGVATGSARVILSADDLFEVKSAEILVVDAVDPNMTFVAPMVAAIVERRGGMLIHGAIIAREYGVPCVTGVAGAPTLISTGDRVTVDGYLGIVTVAS
jgi:pyruvate,water dikinase